jgi:c-di-GMP-binding flagellar brake protein YcgR
MPETTESCDSRRSPRLKLPAMYTLLRVRPKGKERFMWTGYIYDLSSSGMRIELDHNLEPGTRIDFRAMLPGGAQTTIRASGHIVRRHDDVDEPGPVRMGLSFDNFLHTADRSRLQNYLTSCGLAA